MTDKAFVALGSNISPAVNLPRAVRQLERLGRLHAVSRAYRTPPVGPPGQPSFLNAAALVLTDHAAPRLRSLLRELEAGLGRTRTSNRYAPRVIDLDLCLLGSTVIERARWRLPDPDLLIRPYLARVMAELDPDFVHPLTGEPLGLIAARLGSSGLQVDESTSAALAGAV